MSRLATLIEQMSNKPILTERIPVKIAFSIIEEIDPNFDRSKLFLDKTKENDSVKKSLSQGLEKDLPKEVPIKKRATKLQKKVLIVEDDEEERITKKVDKGVATLGPETTVVLHDHLPKNQPPINITVSSYYMNNREKFVNFINKVFEPYKQELRDNKDSISCDTNESFSLLTHQKIVRDYINLYTPYRGLLLYHGLGSGKTCTSIAIAEGMKNSKRVIVMTPASLRTNYIEELKKCGDLLYKKNQFWEFIKDPALFKEMSIDLNLPMDYIERKGGAWFVNVKNKANFSSLIATDKKSLDDQLDEMIRNKYTFINYNGLTTVKFSAMTNGYTQNIFDNSVVIVDEAHNLISRIVNKIKKVRIEKSISKRIYEMLLSASNAKVILLTGTPVINYPNEFGIGSRYPQLHRLAQE